MKLRFRPGYVSDATDIGAEGFFKNGDGVRFRNGLPETVGSDRDATTDTGSLIQFRGVCRSLHDWSDLAGAAWLSIGTSKKLYLYSGDNVYDITPERAVTTPTDPFQTDTTGAFDPDGQGNAAFIRVTDASHGARLGDVVNIASATAVGGITLDGDYEVAEIVSTNEYTIRAATDATSTATGGGTPTITYDINSGLESTFVQQGYGSSLYGIDDYGINNETAPTVDGFTIGARVWSLDNWGEDLLAAPDNGTLYWWDRTTGGPSKAVEVSAAPNRIQRFAVSQQFRFAIAFGASSGVTTERDPLLIRWSDSENFNDWTPTENNEAGSHRIDFGSQIVAVAKSRADFLVWTDASLHRFFYSADPAIIWTSLPLAVNLRIAGPNAAITAGSVTYWMGTDKFYMYNTVHQPLPCAVWNEVFEDFNKDQSAQVTASHNEEFGEVRWDYPSKNSDINDRYVVYNYEQQVWYFGRTAFTSVNEKSQLFDGIYGAVGGEGFSDNTLGKIVLMDLDPEAGRSTRIRFVESGDFLLDEGASMMYLQRIALNFARLEGAVDITIFVKENPQDKRYIQRRFCDVLPDTEYINPDLRGRQAYIKIKSRLDSDRWRMGHPVVDTKRDGTR